MKKFLLFALLFSLGQSFAQKSSTWSMLENDRAVTSALVRTSPYSENQKLFLLNEAEFKQSLSQVADRASGQAGVAVTLPNINGQLETFLVWESSNFEPGLQAKYPEIRAYVGKGISDPQAKLYFSFSPIGLETMVFRGDGSNEFIEAYTKNHDVYVVFDSKTRIKGNLPFNCGTNDIALNQSVNKNAVSVQSSAQTYKTMRLALSCTGEYGTYFGGTVAGALAGMNASMTRVNGVYEIDLAVKLLIIANDDLVIYTDASTDPYSASATGSAGTWNGELMNTLHSILGDSVFDIGHLFGGDGGGGNAGCIGCVCTNTLSTGGGATDSYKGSGFTSPYDAIPVGDNFDIDYVAHEMGHQMGANHTFSHTTENNTVNVEPGSGSTIMGYAGITGTTDVQAHSDAYFAYKSIAQIQSNLGTKTCPISYTAASTPAFTNTKPTVNAGADYVIPISTAFKLTGTASDTAGEVLSYCWEENDDAGAASLGATASFPSPTKTNGPNFRSRAPLAVPVRYFPPLASVLAGSLTTTWETVSSVARALNFSLTVRDNVLGGGQTNTDAMLVTVNASAGPFTVTSQATTGINWIAGSTETITWNVANTTALAGSANVNIKLSTDGGLNFDTVLAANTPNDGTETITVPSLSSLNCRILVEPVGNIYYAVNSKAFTLGASCYTYSATPNAAIADSPGTTAGTTTSSTINVGEAITINNMKVNLKINHTKIGDLVVKITHPDGTIRTLWNRSCNSAVYSGIDITFADGTGAIACASPAVGTHNASQSASALAGFNNKTSAGNWTLTVTDNSATNTGTLVSWGLDFGCTLATSIYEIADLSIYPNPNRGNFTIQFDNAASNTIKVDVYDMRGRKIFDNSYPTETNFNQNIQLNNTESGVYLVSITDGSRKVVKRIVIE
jgi:subtilisin-like proprotein convertase family protein